VLSEGRGLQFGNAKGRLSLSLGQRRVLSEGRGLQFGNAKGRLSLSLGRGRRVLRFWNAQGGLSVA
jgi:hypothetical protein